MHRRPGTTGAFWLIVLTFVVWTSAFYQNVGSAAAPALSRQANASEQEQIAKGRQAVAEAWRNITATGATPLALTDNLNFGNTERPEIMGQFVGCLQGIGEAASAQVADRRLE